MYGGRREFEGRISGFTMGMDGYFYISVGDKGVYHARGKDGSEVTLWGGGVVAAQERSAGNAVIVLPRNDRLFQRRRGLSGPRR